MALESLAPDQRAVVQLVLQQGRSYAALADLLGISEDAVRQRAHMGLGTLGAAHPLGAVERGALADYLLGQRSGLADADAEGLLRRSRTAQAWAREVRAQLEPVARQPLPELPELEPEPEPPAAVAAGAVEAEPALPAETAPAPAAETAPALPEAAAEAAPAPLAEAAAEPAVEGEPAPAAEAAADPAEDQAAQPATPAPEPGGEPAADAPAVTPGRRRRRRGTLQGTGAGAPSAGRTGVRSSRLGGAILLGALACALAALAVLLLTRGDDSKDARTATSTATATATPSTQPLAQLPLRAVGGSKAEGLVQLNATPEGAVGFTLAARNVPATKRGQAYAVWLTGKGRAARRLGFTSPVTGDGTLATSGPQAADRAKFVNWLQQYGQMVVSRETSDQTRNPAKVILRASLAEVAGNGASGGG